MIQRAIVPSITTIAQIEPNIQLWLSYFDPHAALEAVKSHIETLPGSQHERHTMRAYLASLADYCEHHGATVYRDGGEDYSFKFARMCQPTKSSTQDYMASCKKRGLSSSTVTRYMAAVRHWLTALEEQAVSPRTGNDFMYITEAQRQFRLAVAVKNPAPDNTSSRPALEQHGTRLKIAQVNLLFASFERGSADLPDITTITGKRDLALLYLGITSGLRASELARVTPNSISRGDNCYEIKVRGKRSNNDPVGIDDTAFALIQSYIKSFNENLALDDPRAIAGNTPIFQPMLRGDNLPAIGLRNKQADSGMSARAILKIVSRRSITALGFEITAHDMRRTCAYLMRQNGFEWDLIRDQLRHKSIGTTERYVGKDVDRSKGLLSNKLEIILPEDGRLL